MAQYQSPLNALFAQLPQLAMQMYQGSKEDKYRDKEMQFQKNNAAFSQGIQTRNADIAEDNATAEAIYRQTILENAGDEADNTATYRQDTLNQNKAQFDTQQKRITDQEQALGIYNTGMLGYREFIAPNVDLYNQETGKFNPELNAVSMGSSDFMSGFKDYIGDDWDKISSVAGNNLQNSYNAYVSGFGGDLARSAYDEYANEYKNMVKDPEQYRQLMSLLVGQNNAEAGYQVAPNMFTLPGEFPVDTPMGDLLKGAFSKTESTGNFWEELGKYNSTEPEKGEWLLDNIRKLNYQMKGGSLVDVLINKNQQ